MSEDCIKSAVQFLLYSQHPFNQLLIIFTGCKERMHGGIHMYDHTFQLENQSKYFDEMNVLPLETTPNLYFLISYNS
jgi:hypothetical protein